MNETLSRFAGFGLGMRREHYAAFRDGSARVDFVEVISENFMVDGGRLPATLEEVRAHYPVILHGVSLSVGSAYGVDPDYLARLRELAERVEPLWMSDHLCWTRTHAHNSHDLLPLPLTQEALQVVCDNIDRTQEALGRPLLLENPSSYCAFPEDDMTEFQFIAAMARRTGCYLLLDVNNLFVSAHNHGWDAREYLHGLPHDRIRQVHLAGHTTGDILIDTHDRPVRGAVWQLYEEAMSMLCDVAVMIERDGEIPSLQELEAELDVARLHAARARRMKAIA